MKHSEAQIILKAWQQYAEINDKLGCVFQKIPESFLPYPKEEIIEALQIVAKDQLSVGNKELFDAIQMALVSLRMSYTKDDLAIQSILDGLLTHPESRRGLLEHLAKTSESWLKHTKELYGNG